MVATGPGAGSEPSTTAPGRGTARHRRRWPWAVLGLVLVLVAAALALALGTDHAHEVSLRQAEARVGGGTGSVADGRPAPGVYAYTGSGTERLSLPPLSQSEGPTIPGTVTLEGADCWVLRLDYSTHHWQTWRYCEHGDDLWEAGGQTWQLWAVGPLDVTNLSTFTCAAGSMALPATGSIGQVWHSRCTGTNSTVSGTTVTAGPYRLVGTSTLTVGGTPTRTVHFQRLRTDTGAQRGTEQADVWLDARTGLPLVLEQHLRVTTDTSFGTSTYTQDGVMRLTSLSPLHART